MEPINYQGEARQTMRQVANSRQKTKATYAGGLIFGSI
jgi:hypothetical protein